MLSTLLQSRPKNDGDWTSTKPFEVHEKLVSMFVLLDTKNSARENNLLRNLQLYSHNYFNNIWQAFSSYSNYKIMENRVNLNICKSAVDTVAAKISKNRIKVNVVTDGAAWSKQSQMEKLDRAVWALMHNGGYHPVCKQVFVDAMVTGTGIIHVMPCEDAVKYERVFPCEILVDELDAMYNNPSKMYRYKIIAKAVLLELFPDKEEAINEAACISPYSGLENVQESVVVYEAWDKQTKRHVLCLQNVTLIDEEWKKEFPFVFIHWSRALLGFWGTSLIDEIASIQIEISKIMYYTQQAFNILSQPKIFVAPNSIAKNHWTNKIGAVIPVTGPAPQYFAPAPVNPMVIDYIQMLKEEAYAIAGVSQLSARSEKPKGLDSGKALQTYNDIESERFVLVGQAYEEMHVEIFKRTIDIAQELSKKNKNFEVISGSKNEGLERIKWKDINLKDDMYQVKAFPSSALPQSPEARYQRLSEMLEGGLISPEEFYDLNDMPDLKTGNDIKYSDYNAIKTNLMMIVEKEEYIKPSKYDNLTLYKQMALKFRSYLIVRGAPQEIQDLVLDLIDDIYILETGEAAMNPNPAPELPPEALMPASPNGMMEGVAPQATNIAPPPSAEQSGMEVPPIGVNV